MRKLAVVVVPVYRKFMPSEAFAFAQCLNVLGHYDISLLHPAGFDVSDIVRTASRTIGHVAMDDQWFRSIDSYNALCLSADFYDAYAAYEYMLIYQLDAYAFRDELADWCARGYDYIGAPWLPNDTPYERTLGDAVRWVRRTLHPAGTTQKITHAQTHYHVGNGGFSLRRVAKMKAVVEEFRGLIDSMDPKERRAKEDVFFSTYIQRQAGISVPDWREGLQFAFENSPAMALRLAKGHLPFGCHYWSKGNVWKDFWYRYIPFDPKQDAGT